MNFCVSSSTPARQKSKPRKVRVSRSAVLPNVTARLAETIRQNQSEALGLPVSLMTSYPRLLGSKNFFV